MAEDSAASEQETAPASPEERSGSGPGFILGLVLGMIAGAAGAALFAPSAGDEFRQRITEAGAPEGAQPDTPMERIRSALGRVRSRVREASVEAQEAAREAEEQSRARYGELTQQDEPLT